MRAPGRSAGRTVRGRWARWVPFALAVALQLVVLYAPRAPSTHGIWMLDKVVHVSVFGLVAWTGRRAGVRRAPLVAVLAVHAVVSEVVQATLLPDRDGNVPDVLADLVGVALGALLPVPRAPGAAILDRWRGTAGPGGARGPADAAVVPPERPAPTAGR